MKVNPKFSCRESNIEPVDLLAEAIEIVDALSKKYSMLATNVDVQHIYALLDGAHYKLESMPVAEKSEGKTTRLVDGEPVEDEPAAPSGPVTATDIAKGVFDFLTRDE